MKCDCAGPSKSTLLFSSCPVLQRLTCIDCINGLLCLLVITFSVCFLSLALASSLEGWNREVRLWELANSLLCQNHLCLFLPFHSHSTSKYNQCWKISQIYRIFPIPSPTPILDSHYVPSVRSQSLPKGFPISYVFCYLLCIPILHIFLVSNAFSKCQPESSSEQPQLQARPLLTDF